VQHLQIELRLALERRETHCRPCGRSPARPSDVVNKG
jgi:hypothetical protein